MLNQHEIQKAENQKALVAQANANRLLKETRRRGEVDCSRPLYMPVKVRTPNRRAK